MSSVSESLNLETRNNVIPPFLEYEGEESFTISSLSELIDLENRNNIVPPFLEYEGQESFFGGEPPLPVWVGYAIILGFGVFFSVFIPCVVYMNLYVGKKGKITSEYFQ